jgi:hypothetical protein
MRIKKRSIFKNKENLTANMQSFKLSCNKRVQNEPLKIFLNGPFTCRHASESHKQYFTSKGTPKDAETAKALYKKYEKMNIFCENRSEIITVAKKNDEAKDTKKETGKKQV